MNLLKVLVPIAAILAIAIWGTNKYSDVKHRSEYDLAKAELRSEYLERAAQVRAISDATQYQDETRSLFKWWFTELTELYNKYPEFRPTDDGYLKDLEARKAAGQVKPEEYEGYKASYDQVKEVYDLIKAGKYSPAMSASDADLHIDFLEFDPAVEDGNKGVKGRFVIWGAQRRRTEDRTPAGVTNKRVDVQLQLGDVSLKLAGANGKPVAEASFGIPAGPYVPIPEQKIEDFPALAYIGTFFFPLLPYEGIKAEIDTSATSRSGAGNDITSAFKWEREVPANWRLAEGQKWEGAEVEEREELGK
jgi:hypothetical protein